MSLVPHSQEQSSLLSRFDQVYSEVHEWEKARRKVEVRIANKKFQQANLEKQIYDGRFLCGIMVPCV